MTNHPPPMRDSGVERILVVPQSLPGELGLFDGGRRGAAIDILVDRNHL